MGSISSCYYYCCCCCDQSESPTIEQASSSSFAALAGCANNCSSKNNNNNNNIKAESKLMIGEQLLQQNQSEQQLQHTLSESIETWLRTDYRLLARAQRISRTKAGLRVCRAITAAQLTRAEVELIRREPTASEEVRLIMNAPFSEISRITDRLYLTGVGGLTIENFRSLALRLIVNVTYEMPMLSRENIFSIRIPVDDDPDDDIGMYFDEIADLLHRAIDLHGFSAVVHCVAGASRSSSIVIAYLIKHKAFTLKDAFAHVRAARECARPNMGFFRQLIRFERSTRGGAISVQMSEHLVSGVRVRVPNFYRTEYPTLFAAEVKKQQRAEQQQQQQQQSQQTPQGPAASGRRATLPKYLEITAPPDSINSANNSGAIPTRSRSFKIQPISDINSNSNNTIISGGGCYNRVSNVTLPNNNNRYQPPPQPPPQHHQQPQQTTTTATATKTKEGKVRCLKDTYNEINQIRIQSFYAKAKT